MTRRALTAAAALAAAVLTTAAAPAAAAPPRERGPTRLNEVQVIGTHNSYKRETSPAEQAEYERLIATPGDYGKFLAYSHVPLGDQFAGQQVRGLELDLFPDPEGGLYAEPLVRRNLGLGPLPDPAWRAAGIKTLHIADFDYETSCVQFVSCLQRVEDWSLANPGHVPLQIMLELKASDGRAVARGGVVAPPWEAKALDALDAEIRSVFSEEQLLTPDDVRRPGKTLERSVLEDGWPSLGRSRGKVAFLLDNEPTDRLIRTIYTAGRPNLEGRVLFTNSRPGQPDAAFIKRNDPRGANTAQIQELVRQGYLVRTRSDVPLTTVTSGDTQMRDAALASGAQLVSTDFPAPGLTARYGSDFVARLPGGAPVRCNPVNARAGCRDPRLEALRGRR